VSEAIDAAVFAGVVAVLVLLSVIDVRRRIVPDRIVLPAAALVLAARTLAHPSPVWFLAGLATAVFLLVLGARGGIGMGDVKLGLLLGFAAGRGVLLALPLAFLVAAIPALVLFGRHGRGARGMAIPLVPFLALGESVVLLAGVVIAR
jgi:leader peptidase (prepilin peptidase) / N-methyltransferase